MVKPALIGTFLTAFVAVSPSAAAQQNDVATDQTVAPLFASHSPLQVRIAAPLTTLIKTRPDEDYLDGTFTFTGENGVEQTVDLKVRTRGNFRRKRQTCPFPPIWLNFRKDQLPGTPFAGQDKLKLVTHCYSSRPRYEQLVLREYLAYRIFQSMTDKSYGVRLLQVDYVDTEGGDALTKLAFVIEREDDVARRTGMMPVKISQAGNDDFDPRQQNLVNVFQYLIGNTDFSLTVPGLDRECCHNISLMSETGDPPFTPVPYDFDFSGLVNAPYAEPKPEDHVRNVRTRVYWGLCENNELVPDTIQQYVDQKDAIYALVDELDLLTARDRQSISKYLDTFYGRISKPERVRSWFIRGCRKNR